MGGDGGINVDGIRLLMDVERVEEDERTLITEKIMTYLSAAISEYQRK